MCTVNPKVDILSERKARWNRDEEVRTAEERGIQKEKREAVRNALALDSERSGRSPECPWTESREIRKEIADRSRRE